MEGKVIFIILKHVIIRTVCIDFINELIKNCEQLLYVVIFSFNLTVTLQYTSSMMFPTIIKMESGLCWVLITAHTYRDKQVCQIHTQQPK